MLVLVADEAGRKLQTAAAHRHPELLDEDDLALMLRDDDHGMSAAGAGDELPCAALERRDVFALPDSLQRGVAIVVHSSMSLSGISFVSVDDRGKCSASTSPTIFTAATMPSPGRPAFTSTNRAAIASPQVSGIVTFVIASSATISARCSPIDR